VWRQLGPLGLVLAAAAVLPLVGSALAAAMVPSWSTWLREGGWPALVAFTGIVGLAAAAACINTQIAALLAGWLWGFSTGLGASLVAIWCAAVLGWLLAQLVAGSTLSRLVDASPKAKAVHAALVGRPREAMTTTLLLRLSPVVPFAMVNVLLAAARVRVGAFLVGTTLGVVPRTALVVWAGSELAVFDPKAGPDQYQRLALALVATVALALWLGWATRQALRRRTGDS